MDCVVDLPSHRGTPATWQDLSSPGLFVCDRHRDQFEERSDELGPFTWAVYSHIGGE